MSLLFSLKFFNETREVLLFLMNKFCLILVSVEINLKLSPDFLALLKTSNWCFEMSDGSLPSKQGLILPWKVFDQHLFQRKQVETVAETFLIS